LFPIEEPPDRLWEQIQSKIKDEPAENEPESKDEPENKD
jgi:hypothetical protein